MEKAICYIEKLSLLTEETKKKVRRDYNAKIITIPFEKFVLDPAPYTKQIECALGNRSTWLTRKEMKRQKVPRKMIADGMSSEIYKYCGWEPAQTESETQELKIRRDFALEHAKPEAMAVLDTLSAEYERSYLEGN